MKSNTIIIAHLKLCELFGKSHPMTTVNMKQTNQDAD